MSSVAAVILVRKKSEVLCARTNAPSDALYLCPNRDVWGWCQSFGLRAVLFDAEDLKNDFGEVNDWTWRVTMELSRLWKDEESKKQVVFVESNFHNFKTVFVQTIKYILALQSVLFTYKPSVFFIFRSSDSLLVRTFTEYLKSYCSGVELKEFSERGSAFPPARHALWKVFAQKIMSFFTNAQAWLALRLGVHRKRSFLFVSGALNHLASTVLELRKKKIFQPVFLESEFNLEKYVFCLRYGIPFIIFPINNEKYSERKEGSFGLGKVVFRGVDYSQLFSKIVAFAFEDAIFRFGVPYGYLGKLFRSYHPAGLLLDEDFSLMRRSLAAFSWSCGIESFVVSHGIPMGFVAKPGESHPCFRSSITFVNSDLEKKAYEKYFFDPARIVRCGTPRYDDIFRLRKTGEGSNLSGEQKKPKVVLLCLSDYRDYDFEVFKSVLVSSDSNEKKRNRMYIQDLLESLSGRNDVLVQIKPHYFGDREKVLEYVRSLNPKVNYVVTEERAEIFKLQNNADLMVTPESTVISEGIMSGKPVFVMNYTGLDLTLPIEESGLITHIHNRSELDNALKSFLDDNTVRRRFFVMLEEKLSFFSDYFDGKNTERVADYIAQHVRQ